MDELQDHTPKAEGKAVVQSVSGLHARPSLALVKLAKRFQSKIEVSFDQAGPWTDAKSIVKLMRLKVPKDATLYVRAEGPDAHDAVRAVLGLIEGQASSDG